MTNEKKALWEPLGTALSQRARVLSMRSVPTFLLIRSMIPSLSEDVESSENGALLTARDECNANTNGTNGTQLKLTFSRAFTNIAIIGPTIPSLTHSKIVCLTDHKS